MREKLAAGFYGTLSWVVWSVTICGIFFLIFLLCTGHTRRPTVTVESAAIAAADETDPALAERNLAPAGWYTLTMELELRGSPWSPFDYRTDGFHLTEPKELRLGTNHFITLSENNVFSWAAPVKTTLTLYVQHAGDPAALVETLRGARFCFDNLYQQLGFISGSIWFDIPGFSPADAQDLTVVPALT